MDGAIASLKQRVTIVAVASAVLGLLSVGFGFYFSYVLNNELLNTLREELPDDENIQNLPDASPSWVVFVQVLVVLMVPALGFLGSSQENTGLLGGFVGANGCCCCCNCCNIFVLWFFVTLVGAVVPVFGDMYQTCDAHEHCPIVNDNESKAVDCLAKTLWRDQYSRQWPDDRAGQVENGRAMPSECQVFVRLFLNCTHANSSALELETHARAEAAAWSLMVHPQTYVYESFVSRSALSDLSTYIGVRGGPRRLQKYVEPMPADPIASCRIQEENFNTVHTFAEVIPRVWDSCESYLYASMAFHAVTMVLNVLGFFWANTLTNVIRQRDMLALQVRPDMYAIEIA